MLSSTDCGEEEVVEDGLYASFEGCKEIVNRKSSAIDYLLDYIGDDYYWDLDAEGDGYAPIISSTVFIFSPLFAESHT